MNDTPRRRGRRPNNVTTAVAAEDIEAGEPVSFSDNGAVTATKRRRRASVGGFHLKLSAPERKGFVRRWFNDKPGRIAEAEELAYEHVTETGIKSDSPDSRVRRLVGTQDGEPLYAYLMETPDEEYQAGRDELEERHRQVDQAIREGREMDKGRISNGYGEGSIRSG